MAPKRGRAAVSQGKASKAQKTAKAEPVATPQPEDPFLVECTHVLAALDEAVMPEEARELLKAAAPHSLRTPKAERHEYQQGMVKMLGTAFADLEAARRQRIAAIEAKAEEATSKKTHITDDLAAAEAAVADKQAANEALGKALKEAQDAATAAAAGVKAENTKASELQATKEACASRKAEMERIQLEVWQPLKACNFAGKDWRQRDKAIESFMRSIAGAGLDTSLEKALPVALRKKSGEERGPFAEKVLEVGEEALQSRLAKLAEELAVAEAEAAAHGQAIATAEEAKATADEAMAAAMEASIAADNEHLAASEALRKLHERIPELEAEVSEAAKELEAARQQLTQCLELAARFTHLEEGQPLVEPAETGA